MQFETYQPHPALLEPITTEQRMRATRWLVSAYNDGRIDPLDYEERYAAVQQAQTRGQMDAAFSGLITPTLRPGTLATTATTGLQRPQEFGATAPRTALATVAHVVPLFTWIFGPLAILMVTRRGTYANSEALKSFIWQLQAGMGIVLAAFLTDFLPSSLTGGIVAVMMMAWFVLTMLGAANASQGRDWTNPVSRALSWGGRRRRST